MIATQADRLSISRMRRDLDAEVIGYHVYLFGTITAARAAARRLAAHGAAEGTVVTAEDDAAGTLHVSVLLRPPLAPRDVPGFAPIAALAADEAVETGGMATAIHWPSDVVVDGRALATTEAQWESIDDRVTHVILGVDMDLGAAGAAVDRNALVARYLTRLEQWYRVFTARGPAAVQAARYTHGAHRGRPLAVQAAQ